MRHSDSQFEDGEGAEMRVQWLIQCDDIQRRHDGPYTLEGIGHRGFLLTAGDRAHLHQPLMVCLVVEDDDESGEQFELSYALVIPSVPGVPSPTWTSGSRWCGTWSKTSWVGRSVGPRDSSPGTRCLLSAPCFPAITVPIEEVTRNGRDPSRLADVRHRHRRLCRRQRRAPTQNPSRRHHHLLSDGLHTPARSSASITERACVLAAGPFAASSLFVAAALAESPPPHHLTRGNEDRR